MAKYKIYVNGNNQANNAQTQAQTNQLMQQMAQNAANQQLQAQTQPDENLTRQTVNELVKSSLLNPVEIPRYTTIKDVLDAPKGERLTTFTEFLNNPETMRTIGNLMPYYGYNPQTGEGYSVMEAPARRQEALMKAEQAKALEQQKQQNAVLNNVYDAYNRMDIANEQNKLRRELAEQELKWKREEAALDRSLRREQMNNDLQRALIIHGALNDGGSGGSATGGAAGLTPKQQQKNAEMLTSLDSIASQLDRFTDTFSTANNPYRYRVVGGLSGKLNTLTEDETNFNAQRTLLFNKIARELGGEKGVLSDQDIKRIEQALPTLSDTYKQKRAKMKSVYDLLNDRRTQFGGDIYEMPEASKSSTTQPTKVGGYTVRVKGN